MSEMTTYERYRWGGLRGGRRPAGRGADPGAGRRSGAHRLGAVARAAPGVLCLGPARSRPSAPSNGSSTSIRPTTTPASASVGHWSGRAATRKPWPSTASPSRCRPTPTTPRRCDRVERRARLMAVEIRRPERGDRRAPIRVARSGEAGRLGHPGLVEDLDLAVGHGHQPLLLEVFEDPVDAAPVARRPVRRGGSD